MEMKLEVEEREEFAKKRTEVFPFAFEIEKEWDEIAKKRKEVLSFVLEKAKEFEEMEVVLATRIRNKMKTCIRGIHPEQNTNTFDPPIEFIELEEKKRPIRYADNLFPSNDTTFTYPPSFPNAPRYTPTFPGMWSLPCLNGENAPVEKQTRGCLRWSPVLTPPQPSFVDYTFLNYLYRSLNPKPPYELNFTDQEKIDSGEVALVDFNRKHPDTPYTFVEMVSALRIISRGVRIRANFIARPSDGFGDSCPRLFFASIIPDGVRSYCVEYCSLLDAEDCPNPNFKLIDFEGKPTYKYVEGEAEEGVPCNDNDTGTVKRPRLSSDHTDDTVAVKRCPPRFFIYGGVVHPADATITIPGIINRRACAIACCAKLDTLTKVTLGGCWASYHHFHR